MSNDEIQLIIPEITTTFVEGTNDTQKKHTKNKKLVVTPAPPSFRIPTRTETMAANRRPALLTKAENPEYFKQDDHKLQIPDENNDEESNVDFSDEEENAMMVEDEDLEDPEVAEMVG
mmetsp:Transcript_3849/g.5697  ORF Transcript_3849/g.5697 Transcript_3849/m.5697 type:complete len:118 (-) Transcript_3849:73-426(-)